jgi:ankyrin repeat protein
MRNSDRTIGRARKGIAGFAVSLAGAFCMSVVLSAAPSDSRAAEAAMRGDTEGLRTLLKEGADVNSAQGDGMTALHWAAMKDNVELAEMLLYAGANVKATTRMGAYTPLMLAAKNGNGSMVQALVKGGADVNATTSTGVTPLMLASQSGSAAAVETLIKAGAEVNAKEQVRDETALMFAAAYNRTDAMSVLLKHGADVKTPSKVVDLYAFSRELEDRFRRFQQGGPGGQQEPAEGQNARPAEGQNARPAEGQNAPPAEEANARPAAPSQQNARSQEPAGEAAASGGRGARGGNQPRRPQTPGVDRQYLYNELVGYQGGLAPLHFAARQGHIDAVKSLLAAGADINQVTAGDKTSPLLIAIINGHFDLAEYLLEQGADGTLASENGVTPLYGVLNVQWAPKALYPQPRAYTQQKLGYLDLMKLLLDKGVDVNARLRKKVWYSGYNFDLSGVDEIGATAFWRAAYASDVEAMKLLVSYGADPNIRTMKPAGRPRTGDGGRENTQDVSGLAPVPVGGPAVTPLQAVAGVGYGEGFAANSHRFAPVGMMAAVKYLVEELGVDVNAVDHEGNTALHHAAARGDNEMIKYLVSKGANVKAVNREGNNIADMANGPVQRVEPFPETLKLLAELGVKHQNKCVSC